MTLDEDVERMLRETAYRTRSSFKHTLNAAVRAALAGQGLRAKSRRFVVQARPMGLRAGIDPAGLNQLADELETEAVLEKSRRSKGA